MEAESSSMLPKTLQGATEQLILAADRRVLLWGLAGVVGAASVS